MAIDIPVPLKIAVLRNESESVVERIRAIAPGRVHVTPMKESGPVSAEQERALREAHVAVVGANCPRDLKPRMPNLRWVHANFAGVTDLNDCDFWGTDIIMTSARGHTGALPIAEMALAGALMLAKDLHHAARQVATRWSGREVFQPWLVSARTMGIVGLGGIGSNLARMAKGIGMRVIASRRSAAERSKDVDGVDELFPSSQLLEMARQSHFLAICSPGTPETQGMIGAEVFDALPQDAILINIARGEIVDEETLIDALESGKLGGAYLDVYIGERERDPDPRLAKNPNVVITPHISYRSDIPQQLGINVFCDNLQRFLDGVPLVNVVEWQRGY